MKNLQKSLLVVGAALALNACTTGCYNCAVPVTPVAQPVSSCCNTGCRLRATCVGCTSCNSCSACGNGVAFGYGFYGYDWY